MEDQNSIAKRIKKTRPQRLDDARRNFYIVWTLIGACALCFVAGHILGILSLPVSIIAWAVLIVLCLRTPVAKLAALGIPRTVAVGIAYIVAALILAIICGIMFSPASGISDQFSSIIAGLPSYAQHVVDWANHFYEKYSSVLQNAAVRQWLTTSADALTTWASQTARLSADGAIGFGTGVANFLMVIAFALVVAFWILMELPAIGREANRFIPEHRRQEADMFHLTFTRVMGGYIKATLIQCVIIGIACGVGFMFVGIPNAAALGVITGVMNIIPVVGPWIGGVVAALVGMFVNPFASLAALVLTVVIQQFVYTFISPKIMSNSVDVHPALVIIALFAGSSIGGAMDGLIGSVVGMLLSIPCAAIVKSVFVFYYERNTGRQVVAQDGVFFKGRPSELAGKAQRPDAVADAVAVSNRAELLNEKIEQAKTLAQQSLDRTSAVMSQPSKEALRRNDAQIPVKREQRLPIVHEKSAFVDDTIHTEAAPTLSDTDKT